MWRRDNPLPICPKSHQNKPLQSWNVLWICVNVYRHYKSINIFPKGAMIILHLQSQATSNNFGRCVSDHRLSAQEKHKQEAPSIRYQETPCFVSRHNKLNFCTYQCISLVLGARKIVAAPALIAEKSPARPSDDNRPRNTSEAWRIMSTEIWKNIFKTNILVIMYFIRANMTYGEPGMTWRQGRRLATGRIQYSL